MHVYRLLFASLLFCTPVAAQGVKTPFQLVPLWSDEMLDYLVGERQANCSGANAGSCARLNSGLCDDTAFFTVSPFVGSSGVPFRLPAKQTESANPQSFELRLQHAGYSSVSHLFYYSKGDLAEIELVFACSFSGNDCPSERFQTGAVRRIELSVRDSEQKLDLTRAVKVLPDGPIVIPIDGALKESLFKDPGSIYQVRAVAECFSVAPSRFEWTLPVYKSPGGVGGVGTVIVRVTSGQGMEFAYRPTDGKEVPFELDWMEADWGYTFLMQQTMLNRQGDWFQLPSRPFPGAVWIHLPGRGEISRVEEGQIYSLSKKVRALPKGGRRTVTLAEGNYVVLSVHDRMLEIRKEEPFDSGCGDAEPPRKRRTQPYLVDATEVYDADLHLQLRLAYPKGC
jgi:hypothetical protein